jgi:hypothetical protein
LLAIACSPLASPPSALAPHTLDIKEIFNEGGADAQNVPAAVKLVKALSGLKGKTVSDFPSRAALTVAENLRDLRVLAEYAGCFVTLLTGTHLSLEQHLENLSMMSHLLLVLYRRNGSRFVPPQHYANTQRMIRAIFHSVATAQLHNNPEYFPFLDSTDPLEQFFGILRSLHGPGTQFDVVQFEERATAAMSIQRIYARHLDWRKPPKRLMGSLDHMNPRSWVAVSSA